MDKDLLFTLFACVVGALILGPVGLGIGFVVAAFFLGDDDKEGKRKGDHADREVPNGESDEEGFLSLALRSFGERIFASIAPEQTVEEARVELAREKKADPVVFFVCLALFLVFLLLIAKFALWVVVTTGVFFF